MDGRIVGVHLEERVKFASERSANSIRETTSANSAENVDRVDGTQPTLTVHPALSTSFFKISKGMVYRVAMLNSFLSSLDFGVFFLA